MKKLTGINYEITNGSHALLNENHAQLRIRASLNRLVEILGVPSYEGSGDDKTQLEWVFYSGRLSTKYKVVTVYDWKTHRSIAEAKENPTEIKTWNVGGKEVSFVDAQEFFMSRGMDINNELFVDNYRLPANVKISFKRVV